MKNKKSEQSPQADNSKEKKKPGRQPMTAEQKAAAAKARAEEKAKADNLKPEVFVQYQDSEITIDSLVEASKADFRATKKRTLITAMKLYVKPDERTAYYVINETYEGKVSF